MFSLVQVDRITDSEHRELSPDNRQYSVKLSPADIHPLTPEFRIIIEYQRDGIIHIEIHTTKNALQAKGITVRPRDAIADGESALTVIQLLAENNEGRGNVPVRELQSDIAKVRIKNPDGRCGPIAFFVQQLHLDTRRSRRIGPVIVRSPHRGRHIYG